MKDSYYMIGDSDVRVDGNCSPGISSMWRSWGQLEDGWKGNWDDWLEAGGIRMGTQMGAVCGSCGGIGMDDGVVADSGWVLLAWEGPEWSIY